MTMQFKDCCASAKRRQRRGLDVMMRRVLYLLKILTCDKCMGIMRGDNLLVHSCHPIFNTTDVDIRYSQGIVPCCTRLLYYIYY